MKKLNRLYNKYGVTCRTKLAESIKNSNWKFSTKVKELRVIVKSAINNPKIKEIATTKLSKYRENLNITKKLRDKMVEKYEKKYPLNGVNNLEKLKEIKEELNCEKVIKHYKEVDIPQNYRDLKHEVTVHFEMNQKNLSGTKDFKVGIMREDHDKLKDLSPKQALNFLNSIVVSKFGDREKYCFIKLDTFEIESINGWYGGGVYDD